jgi:hypothetical protein
VKCKTAKSISDFLKIVGEARDRWKMKVQEELWFRGEDAKHKSSTLQPKLYRHLSQGLQVVPNNILKDEYDLHSEFIRCGAQLYGDGKVNKWDWYYLMQHHGAPTRLLDWSDSALMALHFAVKSDQQDRNDGYVYVVDRFQLASNISELPEKQKTKVAWEEYRQQCKNRDEPWPHDWDEVYLPGNHMNSPPDEDEGPLPKPELPLAPLVVEFKQFTRRVAAQRSRFTVHGREKNWLTNWASEKQSHIWRISIPSPQLKAIRIQLRDAGVTESVIFPDLDGLGRELNQLWDILQKSASQSR